MVRSNLHSILKTGVNENASDWHLRENATVSLRISGKLGEIDFVTDRAFLEEALIQITTPRLREEFEKTGDADFAFEEEGVGRFRANLHRQRGMIAMSLRHVKSSIPTLHDLGLPPIIGKLAEGRNGIVIVAGITGAGKSTTLAGMVHHMNTCRGQHIISIEDPIEYTFQDGNCIIEQREVGLDAISFNSALTHVLRQDPDAIIIGEMRNRETFETALVAAETGHLVLTTLHTTTAAQSIMRILDLFSSNERENVRKSLANSLRGIICQRLLPTATKRGIVPAVEVMVNTPIVSKLIYENRLDKLSAAIEGGSEDGMISFNHSLFELINNGQVTEETGLAVSDNPQALKMNLKGIFLSTDKGGIIS